jgi:hypothetical protein
MSNIDKETFEGFISNIKREGMGELSAFLQTSDFYTAPCSTKFHLNIPGGLVQHTWNVMICAQNLHEKYGVCELESVLVAALCHDFCKINFYTFDNEPPTDPQITYLRSLCLKAAIRMPEKLNKTYASLCIDHLKSGKKPPLPEFVISYKVDDQLPLGHGEKSLYIAQKFLKLTNEEAMAVRWHMGGFDLPNPRYPFDEAVKKSKLVSLLILADAEASYMMEA